MANPANIERQQSVLNLGRSIRYFSYIRRGVYVATTTWGKISAEVEDIALVQPTFGIVRQSLTRTYLIRFIDVAGDGSRDLLVDDNQVFDVQGRSEIARGRFMIVEVELAEDQKIPKPRELITKREYRLNYADYN